MKKKKRLLIILLSIFVIWLVYAIFSPKPCKSLSKSEVYTTLFYYKYVKKLPGIDKAYSKDFSKLVEIKNVENIDNVKSLIIFNSEYQMSDKDFVAIFLFDEWKLKLFGPAIVWNDGDKTFERNWRKYIKGRKLIYYKVED